MRNAPRQDRDLLLRLPGRDLLPALMLLAVTSTRCSTQETILPPQDTAKVTIQPKEEAEEAKVPPMPFKPTPIPASWNRSPEPVSETPAPEKPASMPPSALEMILSKVPGQKWNGKLEGNGGREVVIYTPRQFCDELPTQLIYHFHGTNGNLIGNGVGGNRLEQVLDASQHIDCQNTVIVYPLSAGGQGKTWMNYRRTEGGDDINKLHAEAMDILENEFDIVLNNPNIMLRGHSAGGKAIKHVVQTLARSDDPAFIPDRLDFFDSSYCNWAAVAHRDGKKLNPKVEINLFIKQNGHTGKGTSSSDKTLELIDMEPKGLKVINLNHIDHGAYNCAFGAWNRDSRKVLSCKPLDQDHYFRLKRGSFFD